MRANIILLLFFMLMRAEGIGDTSFKNYCTRIGGTFVGHSIADNQPNPVGDRCTVKLDLPTRNDAEALEHCTRWGVHVVKSGRENGKRAECVFENVYQCKSDFTQIRGMCYKAMNHEVKTYSEADEACKAFNSEIVKLSDIHLGELFEDQFPHLTRYFVQPDKELESWVTFAGEKGEKSSDYVILFNDAHFYGAGANSIIKVEPDKKANVMCMYRPPETILSFSMKAEKLGSLYYPTLVTGTSSFWRTTNLYTATNVPSYDVCKKSMAAILGTNDGTLLNLDPKYTKLLTDKVRKSFTYAYGPFGACWYRNRYSEVFKVFFKNKVSDSLSCESRYNIPENDYKANWNKKEAAQAEQDWSFLYYPYTTSDGKDFESKRFAIHGPMLCGITFNADTQRADDCPKEWYLYERSPNTFICHRYFGGYFNFEEAKAKCAHDGSEMSKWSSYDEYLFLLRVRSQETCHHNHCDAWVKCTNKNGCTDYQWYNHPRDGGGYGDLHLDDLTTVHLSYKQSVMCEKPAKS